MSRDDEVKQIAMEISMKYEIDNGGICEDVRNSIPRPYDGMERKSK